MRAITVNERNAALVILERETFAGSREGPAGNHPSSGLGLQPLAVEQHKAEGPMIRAGDRD